MPEETRTQEQQEQNTTTTNPQDAENTTTQGEGGENTTTTQDTFPRDYVEKLRQEAAANRVKAKQLEERLKALEEEKLKEQNKYKELYEQKQKELQEILEQQKMQAFNNALIEAARKAGFRNPDDIRLADLSQVELVDGKLVGVEKVIDSLKKDRPYLFNETQTGDNQTGATSGSIDIKNLKNLTPEQWDALLKEAAKNFKI